MNKPWCINNGIWCATADNYGPHDLQMRGRYIRTECGQWLKYDAAWFDRRMPTCNGCLRAVLAKEHRDNTVQATT